MAKSAQNEELKIDHGTLVDWVNEADDATLESRNWAERCRDYYDSKQISATEAKALKQRKQAPVVINRIKPKIDGLAGMERTNRTTARAYPRTPLHEKDATGATEAIRFVLQDNFFNQLRSQAWDNLCVEGTGGLEVVVKPYGKDFKICIHHVMWDRLIYDPHSRRKDFSDARYLGQVVWMDYDQALDEYPDGAEVLESMVEGSDTYDDKPRWLDNKRKRVKIVELYFLDGQDWYYACFTRGGYLKPKKISPYKNEEGETECPYEFASLFVDREGNRYGSALQYLDVQDEINKRRSKALHLMSVRQIMLERGAVEDVNKTRQELAKPDGVIEITPGMEFELLKTNDMAAAQFNLLQEAKNEIDAVGYNAAASGKETKSMSGVALENRRMAGQTEIAPMFDVLRHLDIRVYRKVWNRIKQYWREEKWLRVTDDQHNLKWVALNYKDPNSPDGAMVNNIAELDVDIIIDDAPDSVTMQQEEFVALSEMVKSGIPIPPDAIIEASNLKNKDKILQRMRGQLEIPPQVQEQIQQLQEEHQKVLEENQQLKAGTQVKAVQIQADAQANQQKLAAQQQEAMAELQMKREIQAAELQLAREKAQAEIELERAKAIAQIEIERMKISFNADAECDTAIAEVKNLATIHETKIKGTLEASEAARSAREEGESAAEEKDHSAELSKMHQEFMAAVTKILEKLDKKKTVNMTLPDGRTATAEVG